MIWIGLFMMFFIMACMVTLAVVMYNIVERLESVEDDVKEIETMGSKIQRVYNSTKEKF